MPSLESESYIFDPRPHYPFLVSVKRYIVPGVSSDDPDAVSLILAHATSFHNELWEPVIEDLYDIVGTATSLGQVQVKVREAWAIECPNHGESAVLNEEELLKRGGREFSWDEYATVIHLVLTGRGKGIDVDFRTRKLVGVGHSMGGVATILTRTHEPRIVWHSVFLLEPMMPSPEFERGSGNFLLTGAQKRRDIWDSREAAHKIFREKSFKSWDPRVLEKYVKYGLRELPTAYYPDKKDGVTLKCSKVQEAATYSYSKRIVDSMVAPFCAEVPTHAAFGAVSDVLPAGNRDFVVNDLAQGKFKTVTLIEGAGHLALQHNPTAVAEHLWSALAFAPAPPQKAHSKL